MNEMQSRMKMFEIIDKHLKSGCETCIKSVAFVLYHAQADKNVKDDIDDLIEDQDYNPTMGKESHEDFMRNVEQFQRNMKDYGKTN